MAIWISILLYEVGVEAYLALTPRESRRLRQVSYEKQLEVGMGNSDYCLVIENFDDADEWKAQ